MARNPYENLMNQINSFGNNRPSINFDAVDKIGSTIRKAEEEKKKQKMLLALQAELAKDSKNKDVINQIMNNTLKGTGSIESNESIEKIKKGIVDKQTQLQAAGGNPKTVTDDRNWFEKWANLKPNQNAFFDAMELINRPQQALFGGLDAALQGKDITNRAWESFTGQRELSGEKLLDKYTDMDKGFGRSALGFGIDVVADPLNLVGAGAVRNTLKGASEGAANILTKATAKDPTGVLKKLDEIIGSGGKNFDINGKVNPAVTKITDQANADRNYLLRTLQDNTANAIRKSGGVETGNMVGKIMEKGNLEQRLEPFNAELNNLRSGLGDFKNSDEIETAMGDLRSKMKQIQTAYPSIQTRPDALTKELHTMIDDYNELERQSKKMKRVEEIQADPSYTNVTNRLDEVGKLETNPQLKEAAETLVQGNNTILEYAKANDISMEELQGYMSHVLTDDAKKTLSPDQVQKLKSNAKANDKVLGRKINLTVDEANEIARKKYGVDMFDPNAYFATAKGQHRLVSYMTQEKMIKDVLSDQNLGIKVGEGVAQPKDSVLRKINNENYYVSKGVSNSLNNFEKLISDESSINKFLQTYDGIQRTFKKLALFTGSYHFTNATGSLASQYISGMGFKDLAKYNTEAVNQMRLIRNASEKAGKNLTESEAKAVKEFDDYLKQGISGVGQYSDEFVRRDSETVSQALSHQAKPKGERLKEDLKPKNWLESSRKLAENMDEVFRYGTYKWQKAAGKSSKEAADQVVKTHFNYNDLTGTEREVFRRFVPFYTFTRKAVPFVLSSLITHPDKLSNIDKGIDAAYEATGQNPEITPDYAKNNMQIPITNDLSISLGLPQSSLANLVDSPFDNVYNMLTPFIKVPGDIARNENFTGAPISKTEGVEEQKPINLLKMLGIDATMGANKQYALEQLIPVLGRMNRGAEAAVAHQNEGASTPEALARFLGESLGLNPGVKDANQTKYLNSKLHDLDTQYSDALIQQQQATNQPTPKISDLRSAGLVSKNQASPDQVIANTQAMQGMVQSGIQPELATALLKIKQKLEGADPQETQQWLSYLQSLHLPDSVLQYVLQK